MDGKTLRDKLVGSDDERAVSPVIGVILMVAITVILAAVIATLVMDIGGDQQEPLNAGADVTEDGTNITVTVQNMGNADGVIVADGSGEMLPAASGDEVVSTTGVSSTFDLSGGSGEYIVYAFESDTTPSSGDNAEDQVARVQVIADGSV